MAIGHFRPEKGQDYLTITPRVRVGYELAILISNKWEWNNCFIENAYKI